MPNELLMPSHETRQFFSELPLPKGVNGKEVNNMDYLGCCLEPSVPIYKIAHLTETYRRMQDFYDTINSGRFFLCNAQRNSFPDIYSGTPPSWTNHWIKSKFIDSAIHSYNAAFEIFLQIWWFGYELFKQYAGIPHELTDEN